jgi:hypothetical protein
MLSDGVALQQHYLIDTGNFVIRVCPLKGLPGRPLNFYPQGSMRSGDPATRRIIAASTAGRCTGMKKAAAAGAAA